MRKPFAFLTKASPDPRIITGADGDLVVLNGQTVYITPGSVKQYNSVNVNAGGTLIIEGTNIAKTEIGCKNDFINNGNIYCRHYLPQDSQAISVNTTLGNKLFSFTSVQRQGGGGGGGGTSYSLDQNGNGNYAWGGGGGGPAYGFGGGGGGGGAISEYQVTTAGKDGSSSTASYIGPVSNGGGGGGGHAGGPGGGGGGGYSESSGDFISRIWGGGGGAGQWKGWHGGCLFLYLEGNISGSGWLNLHGYGGNGGNGGGGASGQNSGKGSGGGGGGGGAGGSGGYLLVYKRQSKTFSLNVNVGNGVGGGGGPGGGGYWAPIYNGWVQNGGGGGGGESGNYGATSINNLGY